MNDAKMELDSLSEVWGEYSSMPFDSWIRAVVGMLGNLTVERAAKQIGTNPAVVEAVTRLSMLSDDELSLISQYRPPKTTWFQLANLESEKIRDALEAIKKCPPGEPPSSVFDTNADIIKSKSIEEKVANLEPEVFYFLAKRAKTYGALNDKEKKALFDFARRREREAPLTEKQAEWALKMIQEMRLRKVLDTFPGDDSVVMITLLNELLD